MKFNVLHKDSSSNARKGTISTAHGSFQTPVFMPVGTAGSVKAVHQHELKEEIRASIILGNTYHLFLRPGMDILYEAGGIHRFMGWDQSILTDSGGYQVFSLAETRKLEETGVTFQSHIDGSRHQFTPQNVVDIQRTIGADIMMALDECTPYPCTYREAADSMHLTHRWLQQGIRYFKETQPLYGYNQSFFPIVQGSVYEDLRKQSAEEIASYEMEGNAIGGLSVGEPQEEMYKMVEVVNTILPVDTPRYLMGVGMPENILEAVERGVDMFDCVIPTRNARNGMLFTKNGIINIKNSKWKNDYSPIEAKGEAKVDAEYSKSYLRHLIVSKEILGAQIATLHNLRFYVWLMEQIRSHIETNTFSSWKNQIIKQVSARL